ncbi:MAG: methionine adenosyltransferase [Thermodesulfobacteriota bacterium]
MDMRANIYIEQTAAAPAADRYAELVERKGTGHPDTMCDAIMEAVCLELCRHYLEHFGRILHLNIDKSLLVAGRTTPRLGGGLVEEPMRLIFGDRATYEYQGRRLPVADIAEATAKRWLRDHLRYVDPDRHVVFQNEIKPGSAELTDIFARQVMGANDTSVGVGYAPLSETEQLVLATERFLNGPDFKQAFPASGEDIKVMGCRLGRELTLTVAMALVDRFLDSPAAYFAAKNQMQQQLEKFLADRLTSIDAVKVAINTLDDPGRGEAGMYLTVLGTSAEGADGGQVGRGNRANGLIAFNRYSSTEAAAGKNPVSHVGKIYNLLSRQMAADIHRQVPGIREVTVWLCSQIGKPIDQPLIASAQLALAPEVVLADIRDQVAAIIDRELHGIGAFTQRLVRGELPVC